MSTKVTSHRILNLSGDMSFAYKSEERPKYHRFEQFNTYYQYANINKLDSGLVNKIDKLNLIFSRDSDKFLSLKFEMEKAMDHLIFGLFKQVQTCIEEIEKLNAKLKEKEEEAEKANKNKNEESLKKANADKEILYYKNTIRFLEKKISDKSAQEEILKQENDSYRRQVLFYKDKLKMEITNSKKLDNNILPISNYFKKSLQQSDTIIDDLTEDYAVMSKIKQKLSSLSRKKISSSSDPLDSRSQLTERQNINLNFNVMLNNTISNNQNTLATDNKISRSATRKSDYANSLAWKKKTPTKERTDQRLATKRLKKRAVNVNKFITLSKTNKSINDDTFTTNQNLPTEEIQKQIESLTRHFEEDMNEELALLQQEEEILVNVKKELMNQDMLDKVIHKRDRSETRNEYHTSTTYKSPHFNYATMKTESKITSQRKISGKEKKK